MPNSAVASAAFRKAVWKMLLPPLWIGATSEAAAEHCERVADADARLGGEHAVDRRSCPAAARTCATRRSRA